MKKILILLFPLSLFASTIYMGSGETYTNLQSALSALSGGDTLIIRDGTYTGATNVIDNAHLPPSGSSGSYTVIMAEMMGMSLLTVIRFERCFILVGLLVIPLNIYSLKGLSGQTRTMAH